MAVFAGRYDELLLRIVRGRVTVGKDATVQVYQEDGTTPAVLYTNRAKTTTAANPVDVDAAGNLEFFAAPGTYVLSIREDGSEVATNTVTVHPDPNDLGVVGALLVDEDDMASNSATMVPTQQSVKAYVDTAQSSDALYNTAGPGDDVLSSITTGAANTALGWHALDAATEANDNTALGYAAGQSITTAGQNTLVGGLAGVGITTGINHACFGYLSGAALTDEIDGSTFIGSRAGQQSKGDYNVGVGYMALIGPNQAVPPQTGSWNVAVGREALATLSTADYCTAVGYESGGGAGPYIPITNVTNVGTAVTVTVAATGTIVTGSIVLIENVTGFTTNNPNGTWVVTGVTATTITFTVTSAPTGTYGSGGTVLGGSQTGSNNTSVGAFSLYDNQVGGNNTVIGSRAGEHLLTGENTAVGYAALNTATTAGKLAALGTNAGASTTGDYGTFIGFQAGFPTAPNASADGGDQTCIGALSGQNAAGYMHGICVVGRSAKAGGNFATALGSYTTAGAAGAVAIGCDNTGDPAVTSTANEIKLGTALHTLNVIGNAKIGGATKTVGFYGAAGVAKQTGVAVTAAGVHAALVNLGLIAA